MLYHRSILKLLAHHTLTIIWVKNTVVLTGTVKRQIVALELESRIQTFLVFKNVQIGPIPFFLKNSIGFFSKRGLESMDLFLLLDEALASSYLILLWLNCFQNDVYR